MVYICMVVICSKCQQPYERHHPQKRICRPCEAKYQREYMRRYRAARPGFENERYQRRIAENPALLEQKRQSGRERWAALRHQAVMAYGGYRCACCGECERKFLTMDHVFNDGAAHRKQIGGRGAQIFKWLRDHGYPAGFQVLCMNCNHGKALNGGVCPHQNSNAARSNSA